MKVLKRTKQFVLILLIIVLAGCSKSIIYSPSLDLAPKPLAKKQGDLQGGLALFPEARPQMIDDQKTTLGAYGQYSYGFSDNFTLSLKGWSDIERPEENLRYGFSLSGQFIRPINDQSRFIMIPRMGIGLGSLGGGKGVGFSSVFQKEINQKYGYYLGAGSIWGFEESYQTSKGKRLAMGIGFLAHCGVNCKMSNNYWLNFEVNPIYQINYFDNRKQFLVSPTLTLGYRINKKTTNKK